MVDPPFPRSLAFVQAFDYLLRLLDRGAFQVRRDDVLAHLVSSSARDGRAAESFADDVAHALLELLIDHAGAGGESLLRPFAHHRTGQPSLAINRTLLDEKATEMRKKLVELSRARADDRGGK